MAKWHKVAKSGFSVTKATFGHFEPLWKPNSENRFSGIDAGKGCLAHAKNRIGLSIKT